jgi:hypothetical protein
VKEIDDRGTRGEREVSGKGDRRGSDAGFVGRGKGTERPVGKRAASSVAGHKGHGGRIRCRGGSDNGKGRRPG